MTKKKKVIRVPTSMYLWSIVGPGAQVSQQYNFLPTLYHLTCKQNKFSLSYIAYCWAFGHMNKQWYLPQSVLSFLPVHTIFPRLQTRNTSVIFWHLCILSFFLFGAWKRIFLRMSVNLSNTTILNGSWVWKEVPNTGAEESSVCQLRLLLYSPYTSGVVLIVEGSGIEIGSWMTCSKDVLK